MPEQYIMAAGRGLNPVLIRHFVSQTGKEHPRVCLLPTASGDSPQWIENWKVLGREIGFEPVVQGLFISSFDQKEAFEDVLLGCDAIYVGGGNTVSMLAIWRAHNIDAILYKAWTSGIPLGGGSAGGICWFNSGLTDSRPAELTAMEALGWLKGSFAPHYLSEPGRRDTFHRLILSGELTDGYACDDTAALVFRGTRLSQVIGSTKDAKAFRVQNAGGRITENPLDIEYVGN